jgi:WD40 repeat protein
MTMRQAVLLTLALLSLGIGVKQGFGENYQMLKSWTYSDLADFSLSSNGRLLIYSREGKGVEVFDRVSDSLRPFPSLSSASLLRFSPYDGSLAAVQGKAVSLWDVEKASPLWESPVSGGVSDVVFSPARTKLVVLGDQGVKLLDMATGRLVKTIPADKVGVGLNEKGALVYAKGSAIRELDLNTFQELRNSKVDLTLNSLKVRGDGTIGLAGWKVYYNPLLGLDKSPTFYLVKVYDPDFREILNLKEVNPVSHLELSPLTQHLFYSVGTYLRCVDLVTGEKLFNISSDKEIKALRISGDGKVLASYDGSHLDLYELQIGVAASRFDAQVTELTQGLMAGIGQRELLGKTIAVAGITSSAKAENEFTAFVGSILEASLTRMREHLDFKLVTRSDLGRILKEQGLAQTGLIDEKDAPRTGKLLGAQYLIIGQYWVLDKDKIRLTLGLIDVEKGTKASQSKDILKGTIPVQFSKLVEGS